MSGEKTKSEGSSSADSSDADPKTKSPELTPESKLAIQRYLTLILAPPAVIIAVLSFYLGSILEKGASANAVQKAPDAVQVVLPKLTDSAIAAADVANKAKGNAQSAEEAANKARLEYDQLAKDLRDVTELEQAIKENHQLVDDVAKIVLNNPGFKNEVSSAAGDQRLTFLETSKVVKLINHYGDNAKPEDRDKKVLSLTVEGCVEDCSRLAPADARGAILWVIIYRPNGDGSAHFLSSDSNGNLEHYGVSNYSKGWGGGIVFCTFYGDRKFKWSLASNERTPDPSILCVANIVGWF